MSDVPRGAMMDAMPAPRVACPACGRTIALYRSGRIYRHDPPAGARGRELLSCPASLKVVRPPAAQALLFDLDPPTPAPAGPGFGPPEEPRLF